MEKRRIGMFGKRVLAAAVAMGLSVPLSSGAAETLTLLHEIDYKINLSQCQNEPQLKGALDRFIGSPRYTVGFDDIGQVMLYPGQRDYRLQGQGIIIQGIAGTAAIGGQTDSGGVCGGHIGTGWGETRIRVSFVRPGTTIPATVSRVGGFTTTEDSGRNCMEFFDASGTSLGSGCLEGTNPYPVTTVEFLGGAYAPGIAYVDIYSHGIPYELDLLTFKLVDVAPIAVAGKDQTVNEGTTVVLDGAGSSDPEGQALTYHWKQVSGSPVTLDLNDPVHPTFVAPLVKAAGEVLTFSLTVNDGTQESPADTVDIAVKNLNHPPIPSAGHDQWVKEGTPVQLDATASWDEDLETLTYQWVQDAGPAVTLSNTTSASPIFTAPLTGRDGTTLTFTVYVSDGIDTTSDTVSIFVENVNHAPTAVAGSDLTRNEGSLVMLDGTGSSDPDNDTISYTWRQVSGQPVALSDYHSANPTFTAPEVGPGGETLVFELTVDDGLATSAADTVAVTVLNVNDPPVCDRAQATTPALWPPNHRLVPIQIAGVTDPNNQKVKIGITGVSQDEPVNGLGDSDSSPDAVVQGDILLLRAERSGTGNGRVYRVNFTADDGDGGTCNGSVAVTVPHNAPKGSTAVDDGQDFDATAQ